MAKGQGNGESGSGGRPGFACSSCGRSRAPDHPPRQLWARWHHTLLVQASTEASREFCWNRRRRRWTHRPRARTSSSPDATAAAISSGSGTPTEQCSKRPRGASWTCRGARGRRPTLHLARKSSRLMVRTRRVAVGTSCFPTTPTGASQTATTANVSTCLSIRQAEVGVGSSPSGPWAAGQRWLLG